MIKGFKVRINPTEEQEVIFNKCFGLKRFIYNYCINRQSENYKQGNKFINKYDLKKETIMLASFSSSPCASFWKRAREAASIPTNSPLKFAKFK